MAGRGRPDKFKTHIEPYLDEISEMALTMTERQIAETLDIGYTTFRKYKKEYPILKDILKKGRRTLVKELRSTLIMSARGFHYEESKQIKENGIVVREEVYNKYAKPDVASLNLLLKNYDEDNWANDPQMLKIRQKELELQKQKAEKEEW